MQNESLLRDILIQKIDAYFAKVNKGPDKDKKGFFGAVDKFKYTHFAAHGPKGRDIAIDYKSFIEHFEGNDVALFSHTFGVCKEKNAGILSSSIELRIYLLEGLCVYKELNVEKIKSNNWDRHHHIPISSEFATLPPSERHIRMLLLDEYINAITCKMSAEENANILSVEENPKSKWNCSIQ